MSMSFKINKKFVSLSLFSGFFFAAGLAQEKKQLVFTLHLDQTVQKIQNIGASGCWYTEEIGATWPAEKKERIAQLLFSRELDNNGKPMGIGLSAWRFNIGAGTTEQSTNGGIRDPSRRVECFLAPDGTYDWNKQRGYIWMTQQAKNYGVPDLIAFVNSPPVQFTKNGLGFKLEKDGSTNLRDDKYEAYGDFIASVIKHFDQKKLHFNYISPVNEPQWDWTGTVGTAKQEGSPWNNEEIFSAIKAVNASLSKQKLSTKILAPEAAMLDHLYAKNVKTSNQIVNFWNPESKLYIGKLSNATKFVQGHSYFTENGDSYMINTRKALRDSLKRYAGLEYWQSEYSMLGDGFKEKSTAPRTEMDQALFLAKVINQDFTHGNASAWHYWNAYEPGNAANPRYFLIALNRNRASKPDSMYTITKNLWTLGHYSLLVRPGMYRINTDRNDSLADTTIAQDVMISAFKDTKTNTVVVNLINYTGETRKVDFVLDGLKKNQVLKATRRFVTSEQKEDNMRPYPASDKILPPRSVTSFVFSAKHK